MDDVKRYRERAAEMRARAACLHDLETAAQFRDLARHWDALADHREALVRGHPLWAEFELGALGSAA